MDHVDAAGPGANGDDSNMSGSTQGRFLDVVYHTLLNLLLNFCLIVLLWVEIIFVWRDV